MKKHCCLWSNAQVAQRRLGNAYWDNFPFEGTTVVCLDSPLIALDWIIILCNHTSTILPFLDPHQDWIWVERKQRHPSPKCKKNIYTMLLFYNPRIYRKITIPPSFATAYNKGMGRNTLGLSRNVVIFSTSFSADSHGNITVNVPKTILQHPIQNFTMAKTKASPAGTQDKVTT